MAQEPDWQLVVAFAALHKEPQAPQLVLVLSGVSQPSATVPLQLP